MNLSGSDNCWFHVVQRLPDVAIGRASQSPICSESDPVDTHFWGYSGQVFNGLQAAGYGSDYCFPYTTQYQYLWLADASGTSGFYLNYSGWAKGSCVGTRDHVRLWEVASSVGGGLQFSVGTAHRETWNTWDLTHHIVSDGWQLARDAMFVSHPRPGSYYNWGFSGNWQGQPFSGYVAELGCYDPYFGTC